MLILTLRPDLQPSAVELEYEMFRNAKVANLYKASVLKKVGPGRLAYGLGWERRPLYLPRLSACPLQGSHLQRTASPPFFASWRRF